MIPVVTRTSKVLAVHLPYAKGNRWLLKDWLPQGSKIGEFNYETKTYDLAPRHFSSLVPQLAKHYGKVLVIEKITVRGGTEVCDDRCRMAVGPDCTCRCMGRYHGIVATDGWKRVGETTLVLQHENETVRRYTVLAPWVGSLADARS
jgi:hypothetical protein